MPDPPRRDAHKLPKSVRGLSLGLEAVTFDLERAAVFGHGADELVGAAVRQTRVDLEGLGTSARVRGAVQSGVVNTPISV